MPAPDVQSRIVQGLLAGIGFIGGGAIFKSDSHVHGVATAAGIFSTGVVGAAIAEDRWFMATVSGGDDLRRFAFPTAAQG